MKEMLENTTDVFKTSVKQLDLNESSGVSYLHDDSSPDEHGSCNVSTTLIDQTEENVAMKERALEVITERVDNMDLALGLNNLGGFQPLVDCLKSNHSGVRWRAADAIAVSVQNYQNMQQIAVEYGALNLLTQMYANRSEESSTRYKARARGFGGLLCLLFLMGNSTSELWFLFNNGLAMLRIGEIRIKRKATFVMSQLLKSNAMLRQAVVLVERGDKGKGVLPELVNLLILGGNTTDSQVFEFATSALLALSQDQDQEQAKMMREEFPGLVKVLKERQDMLLRDGAKSEDEDLQELTQLIDTLQAPPAK
ncbi:hypothetical protein GUITHDRAFT_103325 [Guillardia theta CCMP2712]|uniref:Nucleotide exchange factor Fes1 domain-containing protein n=1 Tax=Guillardia theta (strain CCMP2712) TaxID=905079 RepID=L1JR23_GUITC|nr:hypothetical protein GUITHDRAFT_103325 [Guillardia theta CCMP2712]EKX50734.1 hypothetical protein GUITHDRAFT_103325 [Guillardia theta CCMP2712]|eukprot:XP_005837714.1 hypothetical protein GUITHDRAFT_103325 [Guillardia theta CCMP2712]